MDLKKALFIPFMALMVSLQLTAQATDPISLFAPAPEFNQKRFNYALGVSTLTYSVFSSGLYYAWYRQYDQEPFHFFDDWGEWSNMDKYGHFYSSYFQSELCYKGARWTGMSRNRAMWTGVLCSTIFQTTIETMDGFSTGWGWSWSDVAMNTAGSSTFILQENLWNEQRIYFKFSSWPSQYDETVVFSENNTVMSSRKARAESLFGSTYGEKIVKDYNAQIYWASFDIEAFLPEDNRFPKWLNLAIGYGANDMYGGFGNSWVADNEQFTLPENKYGQFYLGLDLDLRRIETNNHLLKTLFSMFNIFKVPMPAIELNTRGEFTFHLFAK